MKFTEMTDSQWNHIEQHLPKPAATGRPRADDRTTINAIMFVLITGCRWIDLPSKYGSKSSAHRRFQELQQKGIWKKILQSAIKSAHKQNKINLQKISVDSSTIRNKKDGEMVSQIATVYADKGYDAASSEITADIIGLVAAFHTRKTLGLLSLRTSRTSTTKLGLLWRDSLVG